MKAKQSRRSIASYNYDLQPSSDFYVNENGILFIEATQPEHETPAFDFLCTVNRNLHNYSSAASVRLGLNKIACFSY